MSSPYVFVPSLFVALYTTSGLFFIEICFDATGRDGGAERHRCALQSGVRVPVSRDSQPTLSAERGPPRDKGGTVQVDGTDQYDLTHEQDCEQDSHRRRSRITTKPLTQRATPFGGYEGRDRTPPKRER